MAPSMRYEEGLPYTLIISSNDATDGGNLAQITVPIQDGFWSDAPRLMRLRVKSFMIAANIDNDQLELREGVLLMSSLRVKNQIVSESLNGTSYSVLAHIGHDDGYNNAHIALKTEAIDVIVETPMNGQALTFELWDPEQTVTLLNNNHWSMSINLYPILSSDTKY